MYSLKCYGYFLFATGKNGLPKFSVYLNLNILCKTGLVDRHCLLGFIMSGNYSGREIFLNKTQHPAIENHKKGMHF
jgi:hypothetical protein